MKYTLIILISIINMIIYNSIFIKIVMYKNE